MHSILSMNSLGMLALYLVFWNLLGFVLMALDRVRTAGKMFRTPAASFFLISILGGSLGCLLGFLLFRLHARRFPASVRTGVPVIFLIQIALLVVLKAASSQIRFL